jgi:hypothetical protein
MKIDKKNKSLGCARLKALVEGDQLQVFDEIVLEELKRFALIRKTYQAEEGCDDTVMCLVMLAWMVDQGYLKDATSTDARGAIARENARRIEDELTPFGFISRAEPEKTAPKGVKNGNWDWLIKNEDPEADWQIMDQISRLYPD